MAPNMITRLRHAVQEAMTPPVALFRCRRQERPAPAQSPILAAFAHYVATSNAANVGALGEDDGESHPLSVAYRGMSESGEPTTPAEIAAQLRFIMAFQGERDFENAALNATPAERAAFYRANAKRMCDDEPVIARAIIALEAMAAKGTSDTDAGEWEAKFARYTELRAYADGLPVGTPGEDAAVDAYCEAMDELIERTPATTRDTFEAKMDLVCDRWTDAGLMPKEVWHSISADYRRLAREA